MIKTPLSQQFSLIIIIGLFIATRLFLACWYQTPYSDTYKYGFYALELRDASHNGLTVYDFHKGTIEYPPLAIFWMSSPIFLTGAHEHFNTYSDEHLNPDFDKTYKRWLTIFKLLYLFFDLVVFFTALVLFIKPTKFLKIDLVGLSIYVISGMLLFNFLYDRLDFWLGGILFFTFILLVSRFHWSFAFILLAIGINFKLIPLLLIPVFLIGSLPVSYYQSLYKDFFNKKFLFAIFMRSAFLIALTFLIFLPFYLWGGKATLDFLSYHGKRGLQLKSTYSSLLMLLKFLGLPAHVTFAFESFNLDSLMSPFFVKVSTIMVLLSVMWILYILIKSVKRFSSQIGKAYVTDKKELNMAQAMPQLFLCLTIATLLASMSASKVLSPQYFLWVVPLFALLSFRNKRIKVAGIMFVAVCLLTTFIYPYLYFTDFVHDSKRLADGSQSWAAPTLLAAIILFTRNVLLISTTVLLIFSAIPGYLKKQNSIGNSKTYLF